MLNQTDKDAINSATESLEQASHAMSKAMYESAAAQTANGDKEPATASPTEGDGDAIDAEFEVKK